MTVIGAILPFRLRRLHPGLRPFPPPQPIGVFVAMYTTSTHSAWAAARRLLNVLVLGLQGVEDTVGSERFDRLDESRPVSVLPFASIGTVVSSPCRRSAAMT